VSVAPHVDPARVPAASDADGIGYIPLAGTQDAKPLPSIDETT